MDKIGLDWSFVEVGGQYQFVEDEMIAMVTVLMDLSDEECYRFRLRIDKANHPLFPPPQLEVGMLKDIPEDTPKEMFAAKLFENPKYDVNYEYNRYGEEMTLEELNDLYGRPVYQADLPEYTDDERLLNDIPDKVVVFIRSDCPSGIVVYGRVRRDYWVANHGQRQLIKKLLDDKKNGVHL